jgi:phosphate:Na+ symporter
MQRRNILPQELIFTLVGGLGLFFLGMRMMSDSLRKVAGNRLKNTLEMLTKRPIIGLAIGTVVTMLVQSSSATTVMTVGFVNAGLLTLRQAISIVLGANIGTTLTAWLISFFALFKITNYALPAIGIGFFLTLFGKTHSAKMWGNFILGFGLLFTGLGFIKDAFSPFNDSEALKTFLLNFGTFPVLGILFGVFITVLLQSSSATIALLQIMAFSGLIDFRTAVPVILGDNIGTTVTAQLAAIGGSTAAKRTAMAHTLLNTIGVLYMFIPVYTGLYATLIERLVPGPVTPGNIMLHIALSHSVFNIINSLVIFLPLIGVLEKLSVRLTRIKPGTMDMGTMYLEKHLLNTPTLALEGAKKEINRMVECARDALQQALKTFFEQDKSAAEKVEECEELVDTLQKEITGYLIELAERELDEDEAETIPVLLHCVNDLERVGDHAVNIGEIAQRRIEQKLPFKGKEIDDLKKLVKLVDAMTESTMQALSRNDIESARAVLKKEDKLNHLQIELKEMHIRKVKKGKYNYLAGIIYNDFVDNMEKIGDHLTNIAQGVLRHMRWGVGPEKEEMFEEVG